MVPTRAALSVSNRPAAASTIPRGGMQDSASSRNRGRQPRRDRSITKSRACGSRSSVAAPKMHSRGATGATRTPRTAMGAVQLHGPRREFVPALLLCSRLNGAPVPGTIRASSASERARGKAGPQMYRRQGGARGSMSSPAGNGGMARPSNSDGSGWRKFSNSPPAQLPAGMSRRQPKGRCPQGCPMLRGREIRRVRKPRPTAATGGTSRRSPEVLPIA